jgi:hypothetical protein
MMPYVLRQKRALPRDAGPSEDQRFDLEQQLWVGVPSGAPVIATLQSSCLASRFGETPITETREGVDQSEVSTFEGSQFGETILTKTLERAGQPEISRLRSSSFGETTITATLEGADRPEIAALQASSFGETTLTRTREGTDQSEGASASQDAEGDRVDVEGQPERPDRVTPYVMKWTPSLGPLGSVS